MMHNFYPQAVLMQRCSASNSHHITPAYPLRSVRLYIALIIVISLGLVGQSWVTDSTSIVQKETMSSVATSIEASHLGPDGWQNVNVTVSIH